MRFVALINVTAVLTCTLFGFVDAFASSSIVFKISPVGASPTDHSKCHVAQPSSALSSSTTTVSEERTESTINTVSPTPPSWDELSDALKASDNNDASPEPLVTLYRDTNGWCPFCERVWLILRAKGIPYNEQLISLQKKPDWYKALVPTTLVPAVLFHGHDNEVGEEGSRSKNERRIVWESSDIIAALEKEFPNTPQMVHKTLEYEKAVKMNDDLSAAGFGFIYAGRNDTLTEEEKTDRKTKFVAELDRLDAALEDQQQQTTDRSNNGGGSCFRLGKDFTAVDAIMVPTLERWRYQLPLTIGMNILENRPALNEWFEAMDSFEPYSGRVAGDEYSWVATNSMFLRYFGGGEDKPEIKEAIQRADAAAERLTSLFAKRAWPEQLEHDVEDKKKKKFLNEAALKLAANHVAVVKDCTRIDPKSQEHIGRAANSDAADVMLRYVTSLLLSNNDTLSQAQEGPLLDVDEKRSAKDSASAARIVASRLCAPRDMSAPAAGILRAVLTTVADRLEEKSSA